MRGEAMQKVCSSLENSGINLKDLNALEFFAREGDWQTLAYVQKVKNLTAWEINPEFESGLKRNLPEAKIVIGDSYQLALETNQIFDFIVFDNPQGLFGNKSEYCEHFEAIRLIPILLSHKGIIVFNVNKNPFNFEDKNEWQKARTKFYGIENTSNLTTDFLLEFYKSFLKKLGFDVIFSFEERRNNEYLSYLVYYLVRK